MATKEFQTPIDIANRALQHCGAERIVTFDDDLKSASEVAFVYDKLRVAELRRNVWRFAIRKAILRAVDTTTITVIPPAYDAAKTYPLGAFVSDATDGRIYEALSLVPISQVPAATPTYWQVYFGPLTASPVDNTTTYDAGELVYAPSTSAAVVYRSLASGNADVPGTVPAYDATVTYSIGDTVTQSASTWQSKKDLNINVTPGTDATVWAAVPATQAGKQTGRNWLQTIATFKQLRIVYPLGSGPLSQDSTRNIFPLPSGFLREAPQDPKAGALSFLGAPTGMAYSDWNYEGNYIVSNDIGPITLRHVADVTYVPSMDPMFCEGLAARIGLEVCEPLTQSADKLANIGAAYDRFMGEARIINSVETGPVEPAVDEYLSVRI